MVTDRQKRNWGKKVFERLDDSGQVVEAHEEFSDMEMDAPPQVKYSEPIDPEKDCDCKVDINKLLKKEEDDAIFIPTKKQLQAKLRFHKFAPKRLVMGLFPDEPGIVIDCEGASYYMLAYIGQLKENEFEAWLGLKNFWEWFITNDDTDADIYSAQQAASKYLLKLMELPDYDEMGEPNYKNIQIKMRVSESILKQNKQTKIENKTVNVIQSGGTALPKAARKMDTVEMENRIKLLKEHSNG